ncbi:hypothetical protein T01_15008 [Trichinella spiralis]|uniref:Uncharacterized protein n=1 Tax=Trichinella spiralis TaxID=6334 RepID=A0A0V1AUE5_TRISP|nr:hypothetical protein T01_15008 [Trichinella spiralis]
MGSVPTDEIIQYPTELHLFLVIRTCNFIRSIRNDYETFLHINILFGIHPAAATDVQTYASGWRVHLGFRTVPLVTAIRNVLPTTTAINHTAPDHEPNTTHQHYMTVSLYCDKRP